ncbi:MULTISPECIES: pyridoxamine 5'-phosphate oxidase family protein [Bacillus]|uniref:pyridoxamine 5'-phosphate oxidase family protein n=1 Tax=Bacillus TaxID=1386 RepID=UPI0002FE01D9|nr:MULTISPECIES: pyridoxamine 5'-phosphate oxidase family protein [Bacillus]MCU5529759.1 pyridoxamine 5'-phosphate oxidase family protein [Bacillus cereus]MDA1522403.1 pyridoxamine 5'-phosphate oxidase family protein [Bacillus cereus]MDA1610988.1 pyridoxamine 5'-phosphate oxidase family protein [Bacillus cereus]MDD8000595.1 pyridoxamine 5'-phosphate oxidase family protein [Bacillus cereus]WNV18375.1 pyridoxamine 5'-phosphate oxidase family protein [Bacillus sp. SI2]
MANVVEPTLTDDLVQTLRKDCIVMVATTDFEKHVPNVSAISWVYAVSKTSIRFAVDQRSRIVENIRHSTGVVLTIMANESVFSISGAGEILTDRMESIPLKLTVIEVNVKEVRDVMFYGAKLATEPTYEKTYDLRAAKKLDNQVLVGMKEL